MFQVVSSSTAHRTRRAKAIAMTDEKTKLEFPEKEVPTKPGNPKPTEDGYDTSFLRDDSTFSRAVKIVASAARAIELEREERRSHALAEQARAILAKDLQNTILEAIQTADRNNTTNYQMLRNELALLKQSDVNQDSKIAQLEKLPETFEERIAELKSEILMRMPEIMQSAMKPYKERLEALEKEAAERAAGHS